MRNSLIRLVICLAALFAGAAFAAEQPSFIDQFNARLDRARATLEEIEKALAEPSLSDGTLKHLRDKNAPILVDLQDVIDKLTPHL
ncbi:MAG: hypothetical protein HYZ60_00140, partial [Methylocystis sp.]|nr:hypothetical protein [Methylocystis sp.]